MIKLRRTLFDYFSCGSSEENDSEKDSNITVVGNLKSSVLRKFQNDVLKNHITQLPSIKTILNFGATQGDIDKEGDLYCNYFLGKEYYTLDKNRQDENPKHFNLDIHDLSKLNKQFDLILLMSVLEHIENPFIAASEVKKIISDNGYLFISAPFFYPIHKDEKRRYSDYWRFTDDGLRVLFHDYEEVWIKSAESVIMSVKDRGRHWDQESTVAGYCALFKKSNK